MSLKNKAMALGLSAAMLLSPPLPWRRATTPRANLTTTAISDSYAAGQSAESQRRFQP